VKQRKDSELTVDNTYSHFSHSRSYETVEELRIHGGEYVFSFESF